MPSFEHLWGWIIVAVLLAHLICRSMALRIQQYCERKKPEPPGSYGWPLFGETLAFIAAHRSPKGVYEFVHRRHQRLGNVFKTRIFGKVHVFVGRPDAAKLVLHEEFSQFTKSYIPSMRHAVGDHSLLCLPQIPHTKIRRAIAHHLLSAQAMARSLHRMDALFIRTLDPWKHHHSPRNPIRVLDYALDMTFRVMCGMLMSAEDEGVLGFVRQNVDRVSDSMLSVPVMCPGTRYHRGMKARGRLMKFLQGVIERRRNGEEYRDDFVQGMMDSLRDDCSENEKLTDVELKDNLLTLIIAGQTTTAAAMMWAVKYLSDNPHVQENLRVEQRNVMMRSGKGPGSPVTVEEVNGTWTYASQVVKEVLRMATVVSWLPRVALHDCTIEGFQIKKGWILDIDAHFIHFDACNYEQPMEFNPSRFKENPISSSFLAFGAGVRTCLGINLARLMIMVFLHRLITTYRWKVVDSDPSLEEWAHFPRLRSGCPIIVESIL